MSNIKEKRENPEELYAIYGGKTFVKIKQALGIGKMLISFVDKQDAKKHADIYMKAEDFGGDLMRIIKNRELEQLLLKEKERIINSNEKYAKDVWQSPLGGGQYDGQPVARFFTIAPGSTQEVVLTARLLPAEVKDGVYVPKKGDRDVLTLRVGCDMKQLKILSYCWSFLEQDYFSKKYSVEAMMSDFERENNEGDVPVEEEKPEECATSEKNNQNASLKASQEAQIEAKSGTDTPSTTSASEEPVFADFELETTGPIKDSGPNVQAFSIPCKWIEKNIPCTILYEISGERSKNVNSELFNELYKHSTRENQPVRFKAKIRMEKQSGKSVYYLAEILE